MKLNEKHIIISFRANNQRVIRLSVPTAKRMEPANFQTLILLENLSPGQEGDLRLSCVTNILMSLVLKRVKSISGNKETLK